MKKRLKQLLRLLFCRASGGPLEAPEETAGFSDIIEELTRDLANVHTAIQRIERKQLRWIELLNLQESMKEPASNNSPQDKAPAVVKVVEAIPEAGAVITTSAPSHLIPGQIVS